MHALVFFVLLVAVIFGLGIHYHFLRELRSRHPQVWDSLGRPTLVMNNSISNGLAVLRFLSRKDYEALDDPGFAQFAGRVRTFDICYTIFFGAILVWNLIEIFAPASGPRNESP